MRKRVVVTGMGCITPLGNDVAATWEGVCSGRSGVGPITLFDASQLETRFAGEVKNFDAAEHFGRKDARRMDRFTQFGLVAALQAVASAKLVVTDLNRDRIGAYIGTGIGGVATLIEGVETLLASGPRRLSPFLVPLMLPDSGGAQVAIHLGIRGPNLAVVSACATGANAIGEAMEVIRLLDRATKADSTSGSRRSVHHFKQYTTRKPKPIAPTAVPNPIKAEVPRVRRCIFVSVFSYSDSYSDTRLESRYSSWICAIRASGTSAFPVQ